MVQPMELRYASKDVVKASARKLDEFDHVDELFKMRGELLVGQTALILGSTSGLGEATLMLFAMQGAKVIMNGHSAESDRTYQKKFERLIHAGVPAENLIYINADVTQVEGRQKLLSQAQEVAGNIDILGLYVAGGNNRHLNEAFAMNFGATIGVVKEALHGKKLAHNAQIILPTSNRSHDWNGTPRPTGDLAIDKLNRAYDPVAYTKHLIELEMNRMVPYLYQEGIRYVNVCAPPVTHTKPISALMLKHPADYLKLIQIYGETTRYNVAMHTLDLLTDPYAESGSIRIVDYRHTRNQNRLNLPQSAS